MKTVHQITMNEEEFFKMVSDTLFDNRHTIEIDIKNMSITLPINLPFEDVLREGGALGDRQDITAVKYEDGDFVFNIYP